MNTKGVRTWGMISRGEQGLGTQIDSFTYQVRTLELVTELKPADD